MIENVVEKAQAVHQLSKEPLPTTVTSLSPRHEALVDQLHKSINGLEEFLDVIQIFQDLQKSHQDFQKHTKDRLASFMGEQLLKFVTLMLSNSKVEVFGDFWPEDFVQIMAEAKVCCKPGWGNCKNSRTASAKDPCNWKACKNTSTRTKPKSHHAPKKPWTEISPIWSKFSI